MFKSNLNKISGEQKMALENIKLLYKSREAVIKLFNDYSSFVSEDKYKTIHGKRYLSMLAHEVRVAKVSDHSNLKIISPKQMLQRLPIALPQLQAGNTSKNLLNEIRQISYYLYQAKEITIQQYNEFHKVLKQNGYYNYEFWE